MMTGLIVNNKR